MPPEPIQQPRTPKTLEELVADVGIYPADAYHFVQEGLSHTVRRQHGSTDSTKTTPTKSRHVTGQQLCESLRDLARAHWGLMARTVLRRWNITSTLDFGRIVFALIDVEQMQKTDEDTIEDFRNVYDFKTAFESDYRISLEAPAATASARS